VDPAQPGQNEVSIHILDDAGQPADITKDVELRFALPEADVAPLSRVPNPHGAGMYHHNGPEMAMPGTWEVEVRALISEFEILTSTFEVPVAGTP
jgi:copper transport protein